MGTRGPAPKRESQRRRRNKPATEVEHAEAAPVEAAAAPPPDPDWHPVAVRWYESLGKSGQSRFYEPSDWATAYVIAESMSREFSEHRVALAGTVETLYEAPRPGVLSAWLKAMTQLLVTEADRRRAALELDRPKPPATPNGGADNVTPLDPWRQRLAH
jgi:hypothetical protein